MSAGRMRPRAEKSLVPFRYVQTAVIEVARIRSRVSGSVVYSSRGYPSNAESRVLSTTRFATPDETSRPSQFRVTTVVHDSPPAWTKAWGCGRPPTVIRFHRA